MLSLVLASSLAGVPFAPHVQTFGHAVKNGHLPASTEVLAFEHNCTAAPCAITQVHVPSIYPPNPSDWDWQDGRIRFYVDGETTASVDITLLELGWVSQYASLGHKPHRAGAGGGSFDNRGLPWGIDKFGHTASSGGIYSTVRVPFGKTVRVTIQSQKDTVGDSVYWMIVRGVEGLPVTVGGVTLPATARLRIHRTTDAVLQKSQFVTLANATSGTSGAIFGTKFDADSASLSFLEACMRLYPAFTATKPIFLSSGAEDYFLSASYFDEGEFITPESGLTYKQGGGIGACVSFWWPPS